jgi:hypothetical protein
VGNREAELLRNILELRDGRKVAAVFSRRIQLGDWYARGISHGSLRLRACRIKWKEYPEEQAKEGQNSK